MASDDVGSRPSRFMITPNTEHHPNNTKTDQLPISEVITGLPRPYHNNAIKISTRFILPRNVGLVAIGTHKMHPPGLVTDMAYYVPATYR